jgi:AcrR family transcriptional regulator
MSISYEKTGRVQQKRRTKAALVAATRELLARGRTPTVEEAAADAGISRATAYRYFRNQRSLLVAAHPELEAESLLGSNPPDDAERRLDRVVSEILRTTIETEPQLRSMLRMSLDPRSGESDELVLRKGRRIIWVEDALAPLRDRLPPAELRRLIDAIAATVGIDVLVWMTDVAGHSREEAAEIMHWSARALLNSALAGQA